MHRVTVIKIQDKTPTIDDTAWVSPGATVVGAVTLGPQVGIWFGAAIRADLDSVEIGGRSNVQDNCSLHADPGSPLRLGEGVSVGHNATVHGCTIGDNVLVGVNTSESFTSPSGQLATPMVDHASVEAEEGRFTP